MVDERVLAMKLEVAVAKAMKKVVAGPEGEETSPVNLANRREVATVVFRGTNSNTITIRCAKTDIKMHRKVAY